MKKHFDLSRFWLLLKMELYRNRKGLAMIFVVIFGFHFFIGLLLSNVLAENVIVYEHYTGYAFTILVGGFILSSMAYNDLGNTLKRYQYLMLPVSAFEKFLSMWLLTSIGWLVAITITFTLYTYLANAVGQVLFSHVRFEAFNPFAGFTISSMKYYFVLHGVFLVGAVHFRGYVLPKTLLALILYAAVCGSIAYVITRGVMDADVEEVISQEGALDGRPVLQLWKVVVWLFWWVLAPLSWVITWFGLKEQEV